MGSVEDKSSGTSERSLNFIHVLMKGLGKRYGSGAHRRRDLVVRGSAALYTVPSRDERLCFPSVIDERRST